MFELNTTTVLVALLSLILGTLYAPTTSNSIFATQRNGTHTPFKQAQRLLLVTAHPDDEAMFFAPTLLAIRDANARAKNGANKPIDVFHLCLSKGDAEGFGEVRKGEMQVALDVLGVERRNRWVLDRPDLRDDITLTWPNETISRILKPYVTDLKIDTLLTFDASGVSDHPNHISIHSGVHTLIEELISANVPLSQIPRVFTLQTSPIWAKYLSVLSPMMAKLNLIGYTVLSSYERFVIRIAAEFLPILKETGPHPIHPEANLPPLFSSSATRYWDAVSSMLAYKSQMLWFRYGWLAFSEYMWVNNWKLETPDLR